MNPNVDLPLLKACVADTIKIESLAREYCAGDSEKLLEILVLSETVHSRLGSLISRSRLALGISVSNR